MQLRSHKDRSALLARTSYHAHFRSLLHSRRNTFLNKFQKHSLHCGFTDKHTFNNPEKQQKQYPGLEGEVQKTWALSLLGAYCRFMCHSELAMLHKNNHPILALPCVSLWFPTWPHKDPVLDPELSRESSSLSQTNKSSLNVPRLCCPPLLPSAASSQSPPYNNVSLMG